MNEKKALTEGRSGDSTDKERKSSGRKGCDTTTYQARRAVHGAASLLTWSMHIALSRRLAAYPRSSHFQEDPGLDPSPFNGSLNYVQGISLLSNGKRASPRKCPFSLGHLLWLIVKSSAVGISALLSPGACGSSRKGDRFTIHMNTSLEMPFEWTSEIIRMERESQSRAGTSRLARDLRSSLALGAVREGNEDGISSLMLMQVRK
ncbi:hypothetical protein NC651_036196 [Populus alba x Populus x berolinensis]|nr:hypothetical protein NC651_036196 [Populus alba x Populus x berolinensis]